MAKKRAKKVKKRESPEQERKRFYDAFAALYGDSLTTQEDFNKAYATYTDEKDSTFFKNSHDFVMTEYFNRSRVKEKIGAAPDKRVKLSDIPSQGYSSVPKETKTEAKQKAKFEYLGTQGDRSVYARRVYIEKDGKRLIRYRDAKGRFVKVFEA